MKNSRRRTLLLSVILLTTLLGEAQKKDSVSHIWIKYYTYDKYNINVKEVISPCAAFYRLTEVEEYCDDYVIDESPCYWKHEGEVKFGVALLIIGTSSPKCMSRMLEKIGKIIRR